MLALNTHHKTHAPTTLLEDVPLTIRAGAQQTTHDFASEVVGFPQQSLSTPTLPFAG